MNKKIGIIGFGIEGRAVAEFLKQRGLAFAVFDRNKEIHVPSDLQSKFFTGSDYLKFIGDYQVLFRSPGVRLDTPELMAAKNSGSQITSQIKFFFENSPTRNIIGVTGTKGKGTTSKLIFEILQKAGITSYLAGNFGPDAISLLERLTSQDWVVLELSSFQLEDLDVSPHVAVVLMITEDHLDYHGSKDDYVKAKSAITKFQSAADYAVVNADYEESLKTGKLGKARKYYVQILPAVQASGKGVFEIYNPEKYLKIKDGVFAEEINGNIYFVQDGDMSFFMNSKDLLIRGFHMIQNVAAAMAVSKQVLNIKDDALLEVLRNFRGLEHRLEFVCESKGVKFFNDSISTNVESCLAAAQAFSEPEILILGGRSKNLDYAGLVRALAARKNLKAVALIGEISEILLTSFKENGFKGEILHGAKNFSELFSQIKKIANEGDVVVLSPAATSFDMFADYKERGKEFARLAKEF